jgi:hypothetical protein
MDRRRAAAARRAIDSDRTFWIVVDRIKAEHMIETLARFAFAQSQSLPGVHRQNGALGELTGLIG